MNRPATALFAAVEAVVAVAVGIGVALVPLTLLWGVEYGLQIPWVVFWRAAASIWLVGHGVDVTFVLDAATANATGLSGAAAPIIVTVAALGFAVVTAWLGARAGRRLAETEHRATGSIAGIGVVVVLSVGIALSSISIATRPSLWQSILLPALWYGVPLLVAAEITRRRRSAAADPVTARVLDLVGRIPEIWRTVAGIGIRGGLAVSAVVVAVAGVLVGFLVLGSYAEVITLYEQSHAGVVGGLAITVGQLAFLPDFLGWAVSWIIGPGFAIGTGSNVSPIATTLGPIPGIPVFGALPASGHSFGLLWILVPVVGAFLVAAFLRPRLVRALAHENSAGRRAIAGAGMGITAGIVVWFIAWASAGAFGPGRLATVGAHPWTVGAFAALEVGVPAVVALALGSDLVRLPERDSWLPTREHWHDDEADAANEAALAETPVSSDTQTHEDDGGFIGALGRAGAGETGGHRRFVVEEPGTVPTVAANEPVVHADVEPARSTIVEGAAGLAGGAAELASSARSRVSSLLSNAVRNRRPGRSGPPDHETDATTTPGRTSRPRRLDRPNADAASHPAATADVPTAWPGAALGETEPAPGVQPRRPVGFTQSTPIQQPAESPEHWDTDVVDDIPEHELPWWRRPKGDA